MRRLLFSLVAVGAACVWSASAVAQTKFTGTCACGKPDPQHMLPAGDRPEHNLGVEQLKCSWTKPIELGGDKAKDGVATHTLDASGNKVRFRGVHVVTMQSGDKVSLPYQGSGVTKENKEVESKGTFSLSGGTGKLKAIKGKGTFSCASSGDGVNCDVEGEYELAK